MRKKICGKFSDHPKSNNMSYGEHFTFAASFALKFVVGGVALMIHAVFPFWFKDDASQFVERANAVLNKH
jgi:hypothetical protein